MEKQSTSTYYNTNYQYTSIQKDDDGSKMHGTRRVLIFCLLTTILPSILIIVPLYLRNVKYANVMYRVSDSDIIQINQGQSSIFCQKHSLTMNTTFNAFQMKGWPDISDKRKHIQLKKSMILPDDTLEYWGFYLLKGATVELKACSRYEGSKILIVKGDRILNTCNILDNNDHKIEANLVYNQGVVVTLQPPEQIKNSSQISTKIDDKNDAEEQITEDTEENDFLELKKALLSKLKQQSFDLTASNAKQHPAFRDSSLRLNEIDLKENKRLKRETNPQSLRNPNTVLDTGVNHGGNAYNNTMSHREGSSVSSFENSLYQCYSGNIIINEVFPYAIECKSKVYLEKTTTLKVIHEVSLHGYYYYIFYSDNDFVQNDIHVIFDIYKPTFQYSNLPKSKMCINRTFCDFQVNFLSDESVIVEVPTKDGIEYEEDDSSILLSVCHPRMSVYIIFPVAVLLLILLCAFI